MKFVYFVTLLIISYQQAFAMTDVKGWINKVKPGTFPELEKKDESKKELEKLSFTDSEFRLLKALREKEKLLKLRENTISLKEKELRILEQQIERKLNEMRKMAQTIQNERVQRKQMDEKDITRMVKYYEKMDSENTAVFLNQMDRITASQLLMRMGARKASSLMQLLDPKTAVEITELVTRFKENRNEAKK